MKNELLKKINMTRKKAHNECLSRDCNCVAGKDRDSNFHEVIDELCDSYDYKIEKLLNIINDITVVGLEKWENK